MGSLIRQLALCFCAITILYRQSVSSAISEARYVKSSVCNAQDRIDNACYVQVSASSRLACLASCSNSATCDGSVLISSSSICYHSTSCGIVQVCTVVDPNYVFYIDIENIVTTVAPVPMTTEPEGCQNGGIEDSITGVCDCTGTGGHIGTKCQSLASGCAQLQTEGYPRGTYAVNMDLLGDGTIHFQTYCTIGRFSNSFEVLRSSGSFDKTLTYNDYVNGFHLGPNDFFVGLEALHLYTSGGVSRSITTQVSFYSSSVEGTASKGHNNFVVESASNGYQYSCGSASSSSSSLTVTSGSSSGFGINDMLSGQENTPFSTADHDVDGSGSKNCAQLAQAGWWFNGCSPFDSNPLGWSYSAKPGSTTDSHFHVPGLDMSTSSVKNAFQYFTLHFDE